jgi:cobalt/nickel transport system ATP-binding protein
MSHHFIKISDLEFTYPDGTNALKNINIFISHGESIAILGENGAGKSTLLKHLNGTILPQKGEIDIGGILITKKTLKKIRATVGIVFQNTDNQLFMPTVYDNVAFAPKSIGVEAEQLKQIVKKALEDVEALDLLEKHPFKLSGGEKRKVCIASVIAISPEILVLDEPTAEISPKSIGSLAKILNNFSHTKIVSTHNLKFAEAVCNRFIVLKKGEIIYDGNFEKLFSDKKLLDSAGLLENY